MRRKVKAAILLFMAVPAIAIYDYYAARNLSLELVSGTVDSVWKTEAREVWVKILIVIKVFNPSLIPIEILCGDIDVFVEGRTPHDFYIASGKFEHTTIWPCSHTITYVPISFVYISPYPGREIPISLMYIAARGAAIPMVASGILRVSILKFETDIPFNVTSTIHIA